MKKQLLIYGKANCPFCDKAKKLASKFEKDNLVDEVVYLDKDTVKWTKEDVAKAFNIDTSRVTTVPQIGLVITTDGNAETSYIGGYNQLVISDLYIA